MADASFPMRINKYLAWKKYSTRREADEIIAAGKVTINGRTAVLGDKVNETDDVVVRFKPRKYRYFAYHKPRGVVTHSPQLGEDDVVTASGLSGVFPVGRLDKDSYGLIILTDDGRVTDALLNPEYEHEKEYRVEVREPLKDDFKKRMESGVDIEGYRTKRCRVDVEGDHVFRVTLVEGKKHQIRRMCSAFGNVTTDLKRLRVMNVKLGALKPGEYRMIEGAELKTFLSSLGL